MLKINLLPPYIYERRKVRRVAFLFGLLFVASLAGMVGWWMALGSKERELTIQVADMERRADEVRQLEQQLQTEQARIPPIKAKVDFIKDVMDYNLKVPKLYEELARYTYSRIVYRSVQPSGSQLAIQAHARSVGDCGRYLLNMYNASHIFSSVAINAVPGWQQRGGQGASELSMFGVTPPGTQAAVPSRGFDFTVTCTLREPISPPTYGAAGEAAPGVPPGVMPMGPPGAPGTSAAEGPPGTPGTSAAEGPPGTPGTSAEEF